MTSQILPVVWMEELMFDRTVMGISMEVLRVKCLEESLATVVLVAAVLVAAAVLRTVAGASVVNPVRVASLNNPSKEGVEIQSTLKPFAERKKTRKQARRTHY